MTSAPEDDIIEGEAVALPPVDDTPLTPAEAAAVDEAVAWLKAKKTEIDETLTRRAAEIGEFLIERFFGGDLDAVHSQNPHKNVSFRKLCERRDVPFGPSALRRFVQVAVNCRLMPPQVAYDLPPSHHSIVYHVADTDDRLRIAADAVRLRLSAARLRELVKGKGRRRPGGGRKPRSEVARDIDRMLDWARTLKNEVGGADPELSARLRALRDEVAALLARADGG